MEELMFRVTSVIHAECECGYDEYENHVIATFSTVEDAIRFASQTVGVVEVDAYELDEHKQWSRPDNHENLGFRDGELEYHDGKKRKKK